MKSSSNSSDLSDSGWRLLDNGTYVRVYGNQDAMGASGTQGSSGREGSDTRENTDSGWVLSPRTRSSSSSRSFQQFRSSRTVPSPTTHCDDYEEHSPHCNNVGTYNCGLCKCSADFFGMNCECSAEAIPFGFDLEDSCRCVKFFQLVCEGSMFQFRPAVWMFIISYK